MLVVFFLSSFEKFADELGWFMGVYWLGEWSCEDDDVDESDGEDDVYEVSLEGVTFLLNMLSMLKLAFLETNNVDSIFL